MYIEREAALCAINEFYHDPKVDRVLREIPSADVAPVVHGEWELKHVGVGHYWECSVCHTNPCIYVTENTKFCPNCGAKMDGGATR